MIDSSDLSTADLFNQHDNDKLRLLFSILMKFKDCKVGHVDISVLSAIANDMVLKRSSSSMLTQNELSKKLNIAQPHVSRSIKKLIQLGYISIDPERGYVFNII